MKFHSSKTIDVKIIAIIFMCVPAALFTVNLIYGKHTLTAFVCGTLAVGSMGGFYLGHLYEKYKRADEEQLASIISGKATALDSIPSELPPYLDKQHARYSAKLAAAVQAWDAMEDESLRRGKTPRAAMIAWLEKNYESLGLVHKRGSEKHGYSAGGMNKGAVEEVAKVSNWEVDGGPPPTPGN